MKKIILVASTLMLFCSLLSAQKSQVRIDWTPEMDKQKYIEFEDVLSRDAEGFYIVNKNILSSISAGKNTGIIERYDNTMKLVFSKELMVRFHDNEVAYFSANLFGGKFYLFTTFWDNKEKVKYFLANEISGNGDLIGDTKILMEMPEQGRGAPSISMRISYNNSVLMLFSDLKEEKNEDESYLFKTFDRDLKPIWESKLVLPYSSKLFNISKYVIDDNANLHLLGKVIVPKKEREKGEPSFYYTLVSYFNATKEIKEFLPDIGDAYVSGIGIKLDGDGNIIATGFYSEKSANALRGVFYMKINPQSRSVLIQKVKPFDEDFLSLFLTLRKASKGEELYSYSIDHIDIDEEGNTVVVAEQYYVQEYTSTNSSGQTTTRYVYNYNHILTVKFDPQGEVLWWNKIPKLQRASNPAYFSYMYAMKGGRIYVLYNDHVKNIDEVDPTKLFSLANAKDAITVLVSIDENGKLYKESMFEAKDDGGATIFKPSTAQYLSPSEYLVLSTRGKLFKIGKVSFQ